MMKGDVNKIRLPYFVIFIANNKEARDKFFNEELIQVLWSNFLKKCVYLVPTINQLIKESETEQKSKKCLESFFLSA